MSFKEDTRIDPIELSSIADCGVSLFLKRDDLIHPEVSGNKWRKLKYNVQKFRDRDYEALLTFGGAYSNHIAATAAVGKILGIKTIGVIRGDELNSDSNPTLSKAAKDGMDLHFISREEYKERNDMDYKHSLRLQFGRILIIPEGGSNFEGINGAMETISGLSYSHYACAVGTGATAAGLLLESGGKAQILGFSALKGDHVSDEIRTMLSIYLLDRDAADEYVEDFTCLTNYHQGGYAKTSDELISFMREFHKETGIKLDPVYTGKMMLGLVDMIGKGEIPSGSSVLAIHTGGLQGVSGVEAKLGESIFE